MLFCPRTRSLAKLIGGRRGTLSRRETYVAELMHRWMVIRLKGKTAQKTIWANCVDQGHDLKFVVLIEVIKYVNKKSELLYTNLLNYISVGFPLWEVFSWFEK